MVTRGRRFTIGFDERLRLHEKIIISGVNVRGFFGVVQRTVFFPRKVCFEASLDACWSSDRT